jgi:hypothetical protein
MKWKAKYLTVTHTNCVIDENPFSTVFSLPRCRTVNNNPRNIKVVYGTVGLDTRTKLNVQIHCSRADFLPHCEQFCQDNFLRSIAAFSCLDWFFTVLLFSYWVSMLLSMSTCHMDEVWLKSENSKLSKMAIWVW